VPPKFPWHIREHAATFPEDLELSLAHTTSSAQVNEQERAVARSAAALSDANPALLSLGNDHATNAEVDAVILGQHAADRARVKGRLRAWKKLRANYVESRLRIHVRGTRPGWPVTRHEMSSFQRLYADQWVRVWRAWYE